MEERLQKILSRMGISSRRKAEEYIATGRVSVNGQLITEMGSKADLERDHIKVDGKLLKAPPRFVYYLLYKPREVMTTLDDPEGRTTVKAFLKPVKERIYPVGRLDYHSEGLLLLTNDGELAHRVMHASSELPKVYWAKVSQRPSEEQLQKLRQGVYLDKRRTAPAGIRWLNSDGQKPAVRRASDENPWLEVTLIEGRNNQIRRMFQTINHPVEKLRRVRIGPLEAGRMKPGELRELSPGELAKLKQAIRTIPAGPGEDAAKPAAKVPAKTPAKKARAAAAGAVHNEASQHPAPHHLDTAGPRPAASRRVRVAAEHAETKAASGEAAPRRPGQARKRAPITKRRVRE